MERTVIETYIREQALTNGGLVQATPTSAPEAGWRISVAYTARVWGWCVSVPPNLTDTQDQVGRGWDALYMATLRARTAPHGMLFVPFGVHVGQDRREASPW